MIAASPAQILASLPDDKRAEAIAALKPETQAELAYYWPFWARPNQLPPRGHWTYWLILAGRGFGKTRTGAETVREWVKSCDMVNLIGATAADARDIMIDGESGILAICPTAERPEYRKSESKLIWPNGATSLIFTADEPERLRGKQHKKLWCFIAGTKVAVPSGEVAIETLRSGDMVETRFGPRRVVAISARKANVGRVKFSTGAGLTGTGNHPVLTSDGWTMLGELQECQTVFAGRRKATATSEPISARSTGTVSDLSFISIAGYGRRNMDLYRRAMTSIMSMATGLTTGLKIWSASATALTDAIMRRAIPLHDPSLAFSNDGVMTAALPSSIAGQAAHAYAKAVDANALRQSAKQREHVDIADDRSCPVVEAFAASVVSTWEPAGQATVYDLTVEGAHEFIANGIIVHNCDEMASWRYQEAWDQAKFGLRLGDWPQAIVTTTPKPVRNVTELLADRHCIVTRGTSYENRSNLAPTFFEEIIKRYEGTRLGRQELLAEVLTDTPGALWKRDNIRHFPKQDMPPLSRIVVAIDPAAKSTDGSDETGIVAVGQDRDKAAYVLADRSGRMTPSEWAKVAIALYKETEADAIIAEENQGGEMVEAVLRSENPKIPVRMVRATRGKYVRAEPIAALYERGIVYHCEQFEALEDQMCSFTPDFDRSQNGSPDRMDALVWGMTELFPAMVAPITLPRQRQMVVR